MVEKSGHQWEQASGQCCNLQARCWRQRVWRWVCAVGRSKVGRVQRSVAQAGGRERATDGRTRCRGKPESQRAKTTRRVDQRQAAQCRERQWRRRRGSIRRGIRIEDQQSTSHNAARCPWVKCTGLCSLKRRGLVRFGGRGREPVGENFSYQLSSSRERRLRATSTDQRVALRPSKGWRAS